jgi:hypothetical protein
MGAPGRIRTCDARFRNCTQRGRRRVVRISQRGSDLGKHLLPFVDVLRLFSGWRVQNVYRIAMFGFGSITYGDSMARCRRRMPITPYQASRIATRP